jgi:SAM-dependent methyltransferase
MLRAVLPSAHLRELAALLDEVRDVLDERVRAPRAPRWAEARGWAGFLAALDDATLRACEEEGPAQVFAAATAAPRELRALADAVRRLTALPRAAPPAGVPVLRQASPRKRAQVAALAGLVRRWAPGSARVVDLGAGKGHLTRALAEALDLPAVGVERRDPVVGRARALTLDERVRFVAGDGASTRARPSDLLVGLHACGALGDALIERAAAADAGVLLVSCCPQKVPGGTRPPVSAAGRRLGLELRQELLGLANLATLGEGAAGARAVMARRRTRYALWLLLRDAGVDLPLGAEARGVHRRQFRRPLAELAPRVLAARGLPAPSARALRDAERRAALEHGRMRRFSLPRTMLARALEVAIVLDRATRLEEAGEPPRVIEAFDPAQSPRNLAIVRG